MPRSVSSVFTQADLDFLCALPEVVAAKEKLGADKANDMIYFSVPLTQSMKSTLQSRIGLDLTSVEQVPMRWIKGDLAPHVDMGRSEFMNTFLMYLNDNPGQLVFGAESYPIQQNTAYIFNEGIEHQISILA